MLDILPGKILRPSEDTNSDSWPAEGKTQMLGHWNRSQSSIEAPQYSERSQILLSRAFFRHADTHTHTHFSHPTKRRGNCRDWWQEEVVMDNERSWEEPRRALKSPARCAGSSEWEWGALESSSRQVLLSLLPFPHLFRHKLPSSCPLLYHKRQTLPSPLHTALVNPPSKGINIIPVPQELQGEKGQAGGDRTDPTHLCCWDQFGTKQFSLIDRAVLYGKSRGN